MKTIQEPLVKVRVLRASIQSRDRTYSQGDDVQIEASLAHQLREQRLVLIHGLDEIHSEPDGTSISIRAGAHSYSESK